MKNKKIVLSYVLWKKKKKKYTERYNYCQFLYVFTCISWTVLLWGGEGRRYIYLFIGIYLCCFLKVFFLLINNNNNKSVQYIENIISKLPVDRSLDNLAPNKIFFFHFSASMWVCVCVLSWKYWLVYLLFPKYLSAATIFF